MFEHQFGSPTGVPKEISSWAAENYGWVHNMSKTEAPTDAYWRHVSLILEQFAGLVDGYDAAALAGEHLDVYTLWMLQMPGDFEDLIPALSPASQFSWRRAHPMSMSQEEARANEARFGHCSALIRVPPDRSTLYFGHTTWFSYASMLRVVKRYDLDLGEGTAARRVLFSSYPGVLASIDDFYVADSGLTVLETTNTLLNETLWEALTPRSVLSWMRAILASRMATSGKKWTEIFSRYHSGTYNSQWLIVDHNLFTPGLAANRPLPPGLLTMLEEIPTAIATLDLTSYLNTQGYFPSYNRPFIQDFAEAAGYNAYAERLNCSWFTYEGSPRAKIFKRDAPDVYTLGAFKGVLQANRGEEDPLSEGSAGNAIAARFDLVTAPSPFDEWWGHGAHGSVDTKVVSHEMVPRKGDHSTPMALHMIAGPSRGKDKSLPPFAFTGEWAAVPHRGMPVVWDFPWAEARFL